LRTRETPITRLWPANEVSKAVANAVEPYLILTSLNTVDASIDVDGVGAKDRQHPHVNVKQQPYTRG
jgi:hypothetical protein